MRTGRCGARAGMTLVEVVLATVVATIVLVGASQMMLSNAALYDQSAARTSAAMRGRTAVDRIGRQLLGAAPGSVTGPVDSAGAWSDWIVFDELTGLDPRTGAPQWRTCKIEFRYAQGETNNGIDDNRNGFADEGDVLLTTGYGAVGAKTTTICGRVREYGADEIPNGLDDDGDGLVDEKGLCFQRSGSTILVRLAVQGREADGGTVVQTASTAVTLRNP